MPHGYSGKLRREMNGNDGARQPRVRVVRAPPFRASREALSRPPQPARCSLPESVDVWAVRSAVASPLPRAPANKPVLDGPSTVQVPDAIGSDAVGHT